LTKVLVTGGMGFIGSNFIRLLHEQKAQFSVTNLDAMSYGANFGNLTGLDDSLEYHFVRGSTTETSKVKSLVQDVDVVVNFAAETHVDRSIANPTVFFESNSLGTIVLLDNARKAEARFVQISTDEVYGPALNGKSFTEEARLSPSSPYAASKAAADLAVVSFHETYGLHTVILRSTNNFGPNQFPEKFIPKAIISSLLGRKIPLYGKGTQVRDWIHVADFCQAIRLATEAGESGAVYNVSAGNELPNVDVAKHILRKLNQPESLIQFVEDRPRHDVRYSLDSTRIREKTGWKPAHTFDDALSATVDWYAKNESWWRPLLSDRLLSPTPWKEKWEKMPDSRI
jgi:dTDP-glucose 4,6-dehydratase